MSISSVIDIMFYLCCYCYDIVMGYWKFPLVQGSMSHIVSCTDSHVTQRLDLSESCVLIVHLRLRFLTLLLKT